MERTKRKIRIMTMLGACLLLVLSGTLYVSAAKTVQTRWVKIGQKYSRQNVSAVTARKPGFVTVGKNKYYIDRDGAAISNCFRKINGVYYYFQKNGKLFRPEKASFRTLGKQTYLFYRSGRIAVGRVKAGKKYYYFDRRGRLQKNISCVKVDGVYYSVNEKGVMTKLSDLQVRSIQAAQQFISRHTNSSQTNAQKFRSCFYYLLGNMRYSPGYFSSSSDYSIINKAEGGYELALSTFQSPNLRGNCHRFAYCVGLLARELGYKPTVITTTGDHSFVMIDGGYYDNMYGGLFGAATRPSYRVYKQVAL